MPNQMTTTKRPKKDEVTAPAELLSLAVGSAVTPVCVTPEGRPHPLPAPWPLAEGIEKQQSQHFFSLQDKPNVLVLICR